MNSQNYDDTAPEQHRDAPAKRPDYIAYNVQQGKDGKGYFQKVGAAWPHKDGHGYEVQLESIPLNGRVSLREQRDQRMQEYEEQRQAPEQPEHEKTVERNRGRER